MTVVVAGSTGRWRSTVTAITCVIISYLDTGAGDSVSALVFGYFSLIKKLLSQLRCELVRGRADSRYERFETSPETNEQELLPAVC